MFLGLGVGETQAATAIKIMINGKVVNSDVAPYVDKNSRTLVPIRVVSENLGKSVDWDYKTVKAEGKTFFVDQWTGGGTFQSRQVYIY